MGGGKLFESSLGASYQAGVYITAGVVVAYTLFGGFLAVSGTDFVQGCIMLVALVLVPGTIIFEFGGLADITDTVSAVSPSHMNILTGTTVLGVLSSLGVGLGLFWPAAYHCSLHGDSVGRRYKGRAPYRHELMIVALAGAMATGFFGLAYVQKMNIPVDDAETISSCSHRSCFIH